MRQLFCTIVALMVFAVLSPSGNAQNYESLFYEFDARALTSDDKRFLQAALAFEGHYNGLLDGAWGRLSQKAFVEYSRENFNTRAEEWHMAMLAMSFYERFKADGWDMFYFSRLGLSALMPLDTLIPDPPTDNFRNYRHSRSSFSISVGVLSKSTAQNIHDYTLKKHQLSSEPYSVRRTNFAISSSTKRDGSTLYTRSEFINGKWSTIMLAARRSDKAILNAVAASITKGEAEPLIYSPGGRLEQALQKTLAVAAEVEEEENAEAANENRIPSKPRPEIEGGKTGSGFVVSKTGHILTNAHVITGCRSILVDEEQAKLIRLSDDFDLAVLRTEPPKGKAVAVFSARPAGLNSDVIAVGYPYAGLLGGLNVTRGAVSSLKGLRGDSTTMQITAPVQTGNSGGPLLNSDGEVVGVVVSKLDAVKVADVLGDVPQNVNFAIRGEIAKLFLAQNGIDPILSLTDDELEPVELANKAADFAVFIECK